MKNQDQIYIGEFANQIYNTLLDGTIPAQHTSRITSSDAQYSVVFTADMQPEQIVRVSHNSGVVEVSSQVPHKYAFFICYAIIWGCVFKNILTEAEKKAGQDQLPSPSSKHFLEADKVALEIFKNLNIQYDKKEFLELFAQYLQTSKSTDSESETTKKDRAKAINKLIK